MDLTKPPSAPAFTYEAFISYKHQVSTQFAADFELHIKRYARSPLARPAKVFRDEQYMRPGQDLPEVIRASLAASKFLILLASPEAARSTWVGEELRIWCGELERAESMIIVLTAGTIAVDQGTKQIDWSRTDALPHYLRGVLPALPLFVDLSWAVTPAQRDLADERYRTAINAVVARLRDVDPNALSGREWRIRRRTLAVAWGFSVVLLALLAAATVAMLTLRTRNEELRSALRLAESRQLAAMSRLQGAPDALITAALAVETDPNNESIRSLLETLSRHRSLRLHVGRSSDAVESLVYDEGGRRLLVGEGNHLAAWDLAGRRLPDQPIPGNPGGRITHFGGRIYVAVGDTILDIAAKRVVARLPERVAVMGPGARPGMLLVGLARGAILEVRVESGEWRELHRHDGQPQGVAAAAGWVASAALSRSPPVMLRGPGMAASIPLPGAPFSANDVAISPDGRYVAIAFEDGRVGCWTLPGLEQEWLERLPESASAVAIDRVGGRIAFGTAAGEIHVYTPDGDPVDSWQAVSGGTWALRWIGELLYSGGSDGWVRAWSPAGIGPPARSLPSAKLVAWNGTRLVGVGSDSSWLLSADGIESLPGAGDSVVAYADGVTVHRFGSRYVAQRPPRVGVLHHDGPVGHRPRSERLSKDGRYLAVAWWPGDHSSTGGVTIWDLQTDSSLWLPGAPEYPDALAFHASALLAAAGRGGALTVWETSTGRVHAQHVPQTTGPPVTALAFKGAGHLVVGGLQGTLELRPISDLSMPAAESSIPVGSLRAVEVQQDGSIIASDVDGVRWFDEDLNYRGPLLDTSGTQSSAWELSVAPGDSVLAVRLQSREVVEVPLQLSSWTRAARERASHSPSQ